jgi:hypothetical protein
VILIATAVTIDHSDGRQYTKKNQVVSPKHMELLFEKTPLHQVELNWGLLEAPKKYTKPKSTW